MQGFVHFRHPSYQMKINQGSPQNDENKLWCSPAVKNDAKQQYNNVFQFFRHHIIAQYKQRQKEQNKKDTAKNHILLSIY